MTPVRLPDGTTLFLAEQGRGTPLLLVHGFPLNHSMWNAQLKELADSCRLLAPDLRGFGQSDPIHSDVMTMDQFADDLAALLDARGIREPVCYCGLSMGGYIGFRFAEKYADRLQALILCDTRPQADTPEGIQNRHRLAEKVLRAGPEQAEEAMLPKLVAEETRQRHPEVLAQLREMMVTTPPHSIAAALRGMAQRPDSTRLLPRIEVPALVICGSEDSLTPPAVMREMAAAMPRARYVEIPQAGHMAPMEKPAAVTAALREFLETFSPTEK